MKKIHYYSKLFTSLLRPTEDSPQPAAAGPEPGAFRGRRADLRRRFPGARRGAAAAAAAAARAQG